MVVRPFQTLPSKGAIPPETEDKAQNANAMRIKTISRHQQHLSVFAINTCGPGLGFDERITRHPLLHAIVVTVIIIIIVIVIMFVGRGRLLHERSSRSGFHRRWVVGPPIARGMLSRERKLNLNDHVAGTGTRFS